MAFYDVKIHVPYLQKISKVALKTALGRPISEDNKYGVWRWKKVWRSGIFLIASDDIFTKIEVYYNGTYKSFCQDEKIKLLVVSFVEWLLSKDLIRFIDIPDNKRTLGFSSFVNENFDFFDFASLYQQKMVDASQNIFDYEGNRFLTILEKAAATEERKVTFAKIKEIVEKSNVKIRPIDYNVKIRPIDYKDSEVAFTDFRPFFGKVRKETLNRVEFDSMYGASFIPKEKTEEEYINEVITEACRKGYKKVVLSLVNDSNINLENKNWQTPLITAVMASQVEIIKLLLEKGANPELKNQFGYTALEFNNTNGEIRALLLNATKPKDYGERFLDF